MVTLHIGWIYESQMVNGIQKKEGSDKRQYYLISQDETYTMFSMGEDEWVDEEGKKSSGIMTM